jgi:hypothetical protein
MEKAKPKGTLKSLVIKRVERTDKDKDGNLLEGKYGKYTRARILVESKDGDVWVGGFGNSLTDTWKEGDTVEVYVSKNGKWLNFKTKPAKVSVEEFQALVKRVEKIEEMFSAKEVTEHVKQKVNGEETEDALPWG